MKIKYTKFWGIALVLMLVGSFFVAATPAAASDLAWSDVSTPGSRTGLDDVSDIDVLEVAPDGSTMFNYDNVTGITLVVNVPVAGAIADVAVTYVDQDGNAAEAAAAVNVAIAAAAGTSYAVVLNGTDTGVRDVTTAVITAACTAGVIDIYEGGNLLGSINVAAGAPGVFTDGIAIAQQKLYKSTNSGKSFSSANIGTTLNGNAVVAIAISPDYADDSTVIAVTATEVYRSINGGKSFGEVGDISAVGGFAGALTSIDISPHYLGGTAILAGTSNGAAGGAMYRFTTSGLAWTDLAVGAYDVVGVAFSPNHTVDAEYIAVVNDGTDTYIKTKFGNDGWDLGVDDAKISGHAPTSVCIAFPADYEWSSANKIIIGTSGGAKDDVYAVMGKLPGGNSAASRKNLGGSSAPDTPVKSIAMNGNYVGGKVMAGRTGTSGVKRTSDLSASTVTWRSATKNPNGSDPIVLWVGDTAYAGTNGAGSAYFKSTDDGTTWNAISQMDISAIANITIKDFAIADGGDMWLLLDDTNGTESLFKKAVDGSWERVLYQTATQAADMAIIELSPDYATDNTVYVAQDNTRIWKTANGGSTFVGLTAPANILAIHAIDGSSYYVGAAGSNFYKSGRWSAGDTSDNVVSIVVTDDGTIYVGTNDGEVRKSADDGKKFSGIGPSNSMGAGNNTYVAVDSSGKIYAGSATGVYYYTTSWKQKAATVNCVGLAMSGSALYAASADADEGVMRGLAPSSPSPFQALITDFDMDGGGDNTMAALQMVGNTLYAIADLVGETGSYGYTNRVIAYTDVLNVKVEQVSPKDKSVTSSSGTVTLSWKAIEAPNTETYKVEVSTDSAFANDVDLDPNSANTYMDTDGTSYTVTGLTPGETYYWRIKVNDVNNVDVDSNSSAKWSFTPGLIAPTLKSPAYGADDAIQFPTFSWLAVDGATSYELEVADNPFFANSEVKKPLTHTTWTWDTELDYSTTYYWRVRAVKSGKGILTNTGPWSEAVFTVDKAPAAAAPPPVVVQQPADLPDIVLNPPPPVLVPAQPITIPAPAPSPITPAVIWAIIIIGAVLFIAVIVLIVRTRRIS